MSELNEKLATAWEGFAKGDWQNEVNVRDFIQKNYTPYEGDESFLAGATEATTKTVGHRNGRCKTGKPHSRAC